MWCKHVIDHLYELTDYELLQQLPRGSLDALSASHDRYAGYALAPAYEMLRDRGRADDVVQEALLSVWRRRTRHCKGVPFSAVRCRLQACYPEGVRRRAAPLGIKSRPKSRPIAGVHHAILTAG